jgi:hypothetical protein
MAKIEVGGHQVVAPVMLHARVTSLYSIHSLDLANRYSSHVDAALNGAEKSLVATLEDIFKASQEFKNQYEMYLAGSRNLAPPTTHVKIQSGQDTAHDMQAGLDQGVKIPPLTLGQDGYLYRNFEVSHGPERTDVTMPGGEIVTMSRRPIS